MCRSSLIIYCIMLRRNMPSQVHARESVHSHVYIYIYINALIFRCRPVRQICQGIQLLIYLRCMYKCASVRILFQLHVYSIHEPPFPPASLSRRLPKRVSLFLHNIVVYIYIYISNALCTGIASAQRHKHTGIKTR